MGTERLLWLSISRGLFCSAHQVRCHLMKPVQPAFTRCDWPWQFHDWTRQVYRKAPGTLENLLWKQP